MSIFFVDTSAVAKRYLAEIGSAWVQSWIDPSLGNTIIISEIMITEMRSLLARRVREGLTLNVANSVKIAFSLHVRRDYRVIAVNRRGLVAAGDLTKKYGLRALDAIHLDAALQARSMLTIPITFVTADVSQYTAAVAEAFVVDNPNTHP